MTPFRSVLVSRPRPDHLVRKPVTPEDRALLRAARASGESRVRKALWRSAHILRQFTASEIAPTAEVSLPATRRYLQALVECGYLRVVPAADKREGSVNVYTLVRYSGPVPPRPVTSGGRAWLYDGNLGQLLVRARSCA